MAENVAAGNTSPLTLCSSRWNSNLEKAFSNECELFVFDGFKPTLDTISCWKQHHFRDWPAAEELFEDGSQPDVRIISVHSRGCVLPLKIEPWMLQQIMSRYNVSDDFLDVLESVGDAPQASRAGTDNSFETSPSDGTFHVAYRIQYPELNHRSRQSPFSLRHTAVYHQRTKSSHTDDKSNVIETFFDLIILLHPIATSVLETDLQNLAKSPISSPLRDCIEDDPLLLHSYILKTYMPNWKAYLDHLNRLFTDQNEEITIMDIDSETFNQGLVSAQSLRDLYDLAGTAHILCEANVSIATSLVDNFSTLLRKPSSTNTLRIALTTQDCTRFERVQERFRLLQDRIKNTIGLLEYAVNYRAQALSTTMNATLLQLARNAGEDSATVRIITVFSLIFLPGSFVASIYGMNFFQYSSESHGLVLGQNFWIFVATWLSITLLTLCIYMGVKWRRRHVVRARAALEKETEEV